MKKILGYILALAAVVLPTVASAAQPGCSCSSDTKYFVKQLTFPEGATLDEKVEMAGRLVPSAKQVDWQNLELTAFLHFGVNTFTNREWGDGTEDPAIFNPDSLDTDQWVSTLRDAGFNMVMLTAKHHDGFCLWPTATTAHSVKASPWRDGHGDVVADLAASCNKYGMKLGLYLSPWDRNAECYGDSPRYNDMFVEQLTELLTNYGTIYEVWFDGACGEGPNGKRQQYDWQRFKETIERLQPGAVVAIMGDDVRWVGNEKGLGRETEWSATALTPGILPDADQTNKALGLFPKAPDLGSRAMLEKADKLYWWPSEVDVSIRPGWFYHDSEQPRSLRELANIYINSVGRNSVLLLNIPPDRHGLIAQPDVKRLSELRGWIDAAFARNLALPGRYPAAVSVPEGATFNTVVLSEDITRGQRVEDFTIEALNQGRWEPIDSGTTVGIKRIKMFAPMQADSVRLVVNSSRGCPNLTVTGVYMVEMPSQVAASLPDGFKLLPHSGWSASAPEASAAFDGDASTLWKSPVGEMTLMLDLGQVQPIAGFVYTPRQDDSLEGTIFKYIVETSVDGKHWQIADVSEEFSNIENNPIPQFVYLQEAIDARYISLSAIATADGSNFVTVAEFDLIGTK